MLSMWAVEFCCNGTELRPSRYPKTIEGSRGKYWHRVPLDITESASEKCIPSSGLVIDVEEHTSGINIQANQRRQHLRLSGIQSTKAYTILSLLNLVQS